MILDIKLPNGDSILLHNAEGVPHIGETLGLHLDDKDIYGTVHHVHWSFVPDQETTVVVSISDVDKEHKT